MSYSIVVRGLDEAQARLAVPLEAVLGPAWLAIGEEVRNAIATFPGPVSYPLKWQSEAQRRFYFAMRNGDLPYVRESDGMSQRLGPSWAVELRGFGAVVGTKVGYAPYVQDDELQQDMHHATGWKTDKEAAREVSDSGVIDEIIGRVVVAALGG